MARAGWPAYRVAIASTSVRALARKIGELGHQVWRLPGHKVVPSRSTGRVCG